MNCEIKSHNNNKKRMQDVNSRQREKRQNCKILNWDYEGESGRTELWDLN